MKTIKLNSILMLVCTVLGLTLISCTDEVQTYDEVAEDDLLNIEIETRSGPRGCYELVDPLVVDFPDGTSQEVENLSQLKDAIKEWRATYDGEGRPEIQYPYEVISSDGEIISVESRADQIKLRQDCRVQLWTQHNNGRKCFIINYPIALDMPDGSTEEIDGRRDLKRTIRVWKLANPDTDQRPMIAWPIEVVMQDGAVVTLESREDMIALRQECQG